MIIAIDGPAASGKGTLATRLAKSFELPLLDTGLLYRAVGPAVLEAGGDPADPRRPGCRERPRGCRRQQSRPARRRGRNAASQVAVLPGVRRPSSSAARLRP